MLPSSSDAYTALQNFKMPDAQSVMTQAQGQYGVADQQKRVSDLRGTVNNLQSSLNAVDPSVTGRTAGTFTTEGQRQALVSKEQAPIATNLNATGNNLNVATGDLNTATGNASTLTNAILAQNQSTYQKLLDQYNASAAAEKEQEATRQFNASQELEQQKLAETKREADLSAKGGIDLSKFLNPTPSSSGGLPQGMTQRAGGGFNFNLGGNAVSAATFSRLTGSNVEDILYTMANSGDKYAAQAWKDIAINNKGKLTPALMNKYAPIFWGETPSASKVAPKSSATAAPKTSYTSVLGINNPLALTR